MKTLFVKIKSFRSHDKINQDDDMYRIIIDVKKLEFLSEIKPLLKSKFTVEEKYE